MIYLLWALSVLATASLVIYILSGFLSNRFGYPRKSIVPASNRLPHENTRGIEVDPKGNLAIITEKGERIPTGISLWRLLFFVRLTKIKKPQCSLVVEVSGKLNFYYQGASLTTSNLVSLRSAWRSNWM